MNKTVLIDGETLSARKVVEIARFHAPVALAQEAVECMQAARQVVERAVSRGDRVYGVTTSVGAKTGVPLETARIEEFNRRLLETHNFGHGPTAPDEVVRAMLVILLNSMASGRLGVRPVLATMLVDALNSRRTFRVHVWGSIGQSDMSPMADLALDLYSELTLTSGEALALLNSSALSLGLAAIAIDDLRRLLNSWTIACALSMEGFAANPSILSPAAVRSRPFEGLRFAAGSIRARLEGSYILGSDGPRHLQDPLCFRSLPITLGNAFDCFAFADKQIAIELNASQNNPVVSIEDETLISVANFDMLSLSMSLDTLRLAFSPVVTSSTERVAKLTDSFWSGLPVGLIEEDGVGLPGFNGMAQFHKSLASEVRLLAAPTVIELASSSHSNGNLDRASMATVAARRARETVELCRSLLAMELMVAAQAVEIRQATPLGVSTGKLFKFVRSLVPYAAGRERVPHPAPLLAALDEREYDLTTVAS
ncbi:aromatic amino acid ammonia-lyase [Paraburkholderia susongensis]|uniref:Histidine ammonia-lyase n=1 Tax=Paraburkholderia susongensis TaxID=1515439 RepID=A0A1X7KZP8_9BURK|nr:aromatic amino acid ammonia-lyase [Paraburkholderia susongensis]SMG46522.1 histidine ammonia-lyase [Paraburkholderia susongensis]